jgi:DNA-binding MarR family transcriptional regulator
VFRQSDREVRVRRRLTYFIKLAEMVQRSLTEPRLKSIGISYTQLVILIAIAGEPGVSSADLARRNGTTPQAAGEIVAALLRKGWIQRVDGESSKKILGLELLPAGHSMMQRADEVLDAIEREMVGEIDPLRIDATKQLLDEIIRQNRAAGSKSQ